MSKKRPVVQVEGDENVDVKVEKCDLCPQLPSESSNWVQCDNCKKWFHDQCLGMTPEQISSYVTLHCRDCVESAGESTKKRISSRKKTKIDYVALNMGDNSTSIIKGLHPHAVMLKSFNEDHGVELQEGVHFYKKNGTDVSLAFVAATKFEKPIYVPQNKTDGLEMKMPKKLTVSEVASALGEDTPVEVMDVMTQDALKGWSLSEWEEYYNDKNDRDKIRNVISLEVSDSSLGAQIKRPKIVEELDVLDKAWPNSVPRKSVAKYCLMSVKDSYTDFHIDFAGTQVYYNVIYGSKQFLFFPPTKYNLKAYSKWSMLEDQNSIYFPQFLESQGKISDQDQGFTLTLSQGDLMLIPSGWIHAVFTPQDSLVIGGNFLTLISMEKQLNIVHIEKVTKVPPKFSFPYFQQSMWFVAHYIVETELQFNEKEIEGISCLQNYLQSLLDSINGCCSDGNEKRKTKKSIPKKTIGDPIVLLNRLKVKIGSLKQNEHNEQNFS